jgi:hypothetical protein
VGEADAVARGRIVGVVETIAVVGAARSFYDSYTSGID